MKFRTLFSNCAVFSLAAIGVLFSSALRSSSTALAESAGSGTTSSVSMAQPAPGSSFHVVTEWKPGGNGGWGYPAVDASRHLLYVPRGSTVTAVDLASGSVKGEIRGLVDARRVALDPEGKYGYITDITDGTSGWVRVFDRSTLAIVATVGVGLDPDAIVFEPATRSVFAFSTPSGNATVIDTAQNRAASSVPLQGRVTAAVADGQGAIFLALEDQGLVERLDARTQKVTGSWPLTGCTGPTGLALDGAIGKLFAACENKKIVSLDPSGGQVADLGPVGDGPGNLALDGQRGLLFCSDDTGTVVILRRNAQGQYAPAQKVTTQAGARLSALDENTGRLYVLTSSFGQRLGRTSEELRFRPTPVPGSFVVLGIGD